MNCWIVLQKRTKNTTYETRRLIEAAGIGSTVVYHPSVDIIVSRKDRTSIRVKNKTVQLPDVVIPRTGSGTGYFGFAMLRHLEQLGVPVINSSWAIEATKDKLYAAQVFAQKGIDTPKTILVKSPVSPSLVAREIGFPAVVKIMAGSYGKGVYKVETKSHFQDFIEFAHGIKSDEAIIVQEYVGTRPGEDLRVFVVGGQALGAMRRKSRDGSFKANITRGGEGEAYPLTTDLAELAVSAAEALGLDVAGVDLLFTDDGYTVCECNSAPGFEGFERATGIDIARAIIDYARTRIK